MMKFGSARLACVALAACVAVVAAVATATTPAPNSTATPTAPPRRTTTFRVMGTAAKINHRLFGVQSDWVTLVYTDGRYLAFNDTRLIDALTTLRVGALRFTGGSDSNCYDWRPSVSNFLGSPDDGFCIRNYDALVPVRGGGVVIFCVCVCVVCLVVVVLHSLCVCPWWEAE